jgi:hypothetical protein
VTPAELADAAARAGLTLVETLGTSIRLWRSLREWRLRVRPGTSTAVTYGAWLRRGP